MTTRAGAHTVRVEAASTAAALGLIQSECDRDQCHCPTEWCTDDVESVVSVREVEHRASGPASDPDSSTLGDAIEAVGVDSEC